MMDLDQHSTVLIAGGGASGLFTAILLAQAGISVLVLEAQQSYSHVPRVISYTPQLEAEFRKTGLWERLVDAAGSMSATDITFRCTDNARKSAIYSIAHKPGAPGTLLLPQWKWIEVAVKRLQELPTARLLMGHRVATFSHAEVETGNIEVYVELSDGADRHRNFTCDFLIGADGGKSAIRKICDIGFEGETLPHQLVATDIYYQGFDQAGWTGANFMVDPRYFGMCSPIDSEGLWRVSFGVPDGMDVDASLREWYEKLLPLREAENPPTYMIANIGTYRAQQLCATSFSKGRVALIGDAAHLTNPYMGLGLASGFYDGASLAEVIISLVHGASSAEILASWAMARKEVYHKHVDPLSRAAFNAVQSSDVDSLKMQHPMIRMVEAAKAGKIKPGPLPLATDISQL